MSGLRAKSSDGARQYYADEGETGALLSELRSHSQTDREIFASLQLELRRIARSKMRFERPDNTLQPTALVNEAFLKLFKADLATDFWRDKSRALRLIAHAMEQILIDHAAAHRDSRYGFYGPGTTIRSGCLLGTWDRCIDREPRSGDRPLGCKPHAWGSDPLLARRFHDSLRCTFLLSPVC